MHTSFLLLLSCCSAPVPSIETVLLYIIIDTCRERMTTGCAAEVWIEATSLFGISWQGCVPNRAAPPNASDTTLQKLDREVVAQVGSWIIPCCGGVHQSQVLSQPRLWTEWCGDEDRPCSDRLGSPPYRQSRMYIPPEAICSSNRWCFPHEKSSCRSE